MGGEKEDGVGWGRGVAWVVKLLLETGNEPLIVYLYPSSDWLLRCRYTSRFRRTVEEDSLNRKQPDPAVLNVLPVTRYSPKRTG